jgi:putative ABC transport system permease protein
MRLLRIAREGLTALGTSKLRTFFMMAGTIVGVAALTVVMAIGAGTERMVMKRVSVFGFRAIMVIAGGGSTLTPPQGDVVTLTLADAEAIREIAGIEIATPTAMKRGVAVKAGAVQTQTTVFAVEPDWHEAWEWYARSGEQTSAEDVTEMARVCLLGATPAHDLFGPVDALGQYVQIGNVRFLVKGVLESKGTSPMGTDMDNRAVIPLTTGMRRLFNQDHLAQIRIKVKDPNDLEAIGTKVRALLHERHHITPPQEDDFQVRTAADVAKLVRGISGTLSTLLTALAGLSLLVGGVVLMNILLISVSERVPEIGLRRTLGGRERDIFTQFLTESLAVTLLGMLVGSALGWGASAALSAFTELPVTLSWRPFALAVASSLAVGLFFGIQPARRAARLRPVEALR